MPLLLRLAPYEMRGRTYWGLNWDVDFPALEAGATTSVAEAARLTIPERVLAYLPAPTRQQIAEPLAAVEDEPASDAPAGSSEDAAPLEAPEDIAPPPPDRDEPPPANADAPPLEWQKAREALLPVLSQVLGGRFGYDRELPPKRKETALLAFWAWARDVPLLAPCETEAGALALNVTTIDTAGLLELRQEFERYLNGDEIRARPFEETAVDEEREPPAEAVALEMEI